jgi:hypothetical protein
VPAAIVAEPFVNAARLVLFDTSRMTASTAAAPAGWRTTGSSARTPASRPTSR